MGMSADVNGNVKNLVPIRFVFILKTGTKAYGTLLIGLSNKRGCNILFLFEAEIICILESASLVLHFLSAIRLAFSLMPSYLLFS